MTLAKRAEFWKRLSDFINEAHSKRNPPHSVLLQLQLSCSPHVRRLFRKTEHILLSTGYRYNQQWEKLEMFLNDPAVQDMDPQNALELLHRIARNKQADSLPAVCTTLLL